MIFSHVMARRNQNGYSVSSMGALQTIPACKNVTLRGKASPDSGWPGEGLKGLAAAGGYNMVRLSLHPKAAIRDSWQASDAWASLTWV
jgi:hypothetical protein